MTKLPPVPPDQRSPKGPSSDPDVPKKEGTLSKDRIKDRNLREQGQQGNIYQNTHNQGHQQDR
jgi:hypothetical protein